jgi:anti-sigma B factor antagonist
MSNPSSRLRIRHENDITIIEFVDHLSSAALGALITIHNNISGRDGQLRLADINDQIIEVFRITRLDHLFQICPGTPEAIESFS